MTNSIALRISLAFEPNPSVVFVDPERLRPGELCSDDGQWVPTPAGVRPYAKGAEVKPEHMDAVVYPEAAVASGLVGVDGQQAARVVRLPALCRVPMDQLFRALGVQP